MYHGVWNISLPMLSVCIALLVLPLAFFHLQLYVTDQPLFVFQVKRKPGMEGKDLLSDSDSKSSGGIWDSLSRWFKLRSISCSLRALSIESKLRFAFLETPIKEKNNIFRNSEKRTTSQVIFKSVRKCLTGNFRPVWFSEPIACLSKVLEFWLNGKRPHNN